VAVGPLDLRSRPLTGETPHPLQEPAVDHGCAAPLLAPQAVPVTALVRALAGQVLRVDHLGVNLPARLVARPRWEDLLHTLAHAATVYRYPTGEEWPFLPPSTWDEYVDDIQHFPPGREPMFELCYEREFAHPVVQVDVQTALTREELEERFPEPSGCALPGLGDFQRTVYVAHPWDGLLLRLDLRYQGSGAIPVWETGEWLVTAGGRIRPPDAR
jgi:hypothetical protein